MRRATPPCVKKLPAKIKNGIAMISNFSIPVKSLRATASTGTSVIVKRKLNTVRPKAIEMGIPVNMSTISKAKINNALMSAPLYSQQFLALSLQHACDHALVIHHCAENDKQLVKNENTSTLNLQESLDIQSK